MSGAAGRIRTHDPGEGHWRGTHTARPHRAAVRAIGLRTSARHELGHTPHRGGPDRVLGELPRDLGGRPHESRIRGTHRFTDWSTAHVATLLDKELKRQVTIDGVDYTVAMNPDGLRLTGKGKRRPEVELRWGDRLSGEAAMAVALNASLSKRQAATKPANEQAS